MDLLRHTIAVVVEAGLGAFESLHGEESADAFAQRLKREALALYGTPIVSGNDPRYLVRLIWLSRRRLEVLRHRNPLPPSSAKPIRCRALPVAGFYALPDALAINFAVAPNRVSAIISKRPFLNVSR
jgi:hypothetical protein